MRRSYVRTCNICGFVHITRGRVYHVKLDLADSFLNLKTEAETMKVNTFEFCPFL